MSPPSPDRILIPPSPPSPLPPNLLTTLTSALLSSTSAIPHLQSTLHSTAQSHHWPDAIHQRAKQLISTGQATTPQEVMAQLLLEAREGRKGMPGGMERGKGQDGKSGSGSGNGNGEQVIDVRFPEEAVKAGKEVVRGALEGIVDVGGQEGGKDAR
ncbi:MAG: hypothetical protein LQ349_003914 [Xanthoria aureola]|nr:MAG: hypothetical protein LQ349_003914 [Xanthoria aureola]